MKEKLNKTHQYMEVGHIEVLSGAFRPQSSLFKHK